MAVPVLPALLTESALCDPRPLKSLLCREAPERGLWVCVSSAPSYPSAPHQMPLMPVSDRGVGTGPWPLYGSSLTSRKLLSMCDLGGH